MHSHLFSLKYVQDPLTPSGTAIFPRTPLSISLVTKLCFCELAGSELGIKNKSGRKKKENSVITNNYQIPNINHAFSRKLQLPSYDHPKVALVQDSLEQVLLAIVRKDMHS